MKLTYRLPLLFALMAFLTMIAISLFAFYSGRTIISDDISQGLTLSNYFQARSIARWFDNRAQALEINAQRPVRSEQLAKMLALDPDSSEYQALKADMQNNFLIPLLVDDNLTEVYILDGRDGKIVLASNSDDIGKYRDQEPFFTQGLKGTFFDSFRYFPYENGIAFHISSPISYPPGNPIAVMVMHTNLEKITEIVHESEEPGKLQESYVVNKANFFATDPWLSDKKALKDTLKTDATTACLKGGSGTATYINYRGVEVIGAYQWIPEFGLCFITEADVGQAYEPINRLRNQLIFVGLGISLMFGLIGFLFSRGITNPIGRLVKAAQSIAKGDLDQKVTVETKDEIGELGTAFNEMTDDLRSSNEENEQLYQKLKEWADTLENRVEERTTELQVSENKYRSLSDNSPDIILMFNQDGDLLYSNPQAQNFFGFKQENNEGKQFAQFPPGDYATFVKSALIKCKRKMKLVREETELKGTARSRWLDTQVVPITDDNEVLAMFLLISRDITSSKTAEKQILRLNENLQRSNSDLERFAYIASHDLQEPLRMVASYLQLLERRYRPQLDGDAIEFIDYAVDGASRMKILIQDLLTYSRVNTRGKEFELTNIQTVLDKVMQDLQLAAKENNATVTWDPLPSLYVDDVQFHQLLLNLIGNAIKFRGDPDPIVHIGAVEKEDEWEFSVRDNGIGIDPQYFERIFLIFQRLHTREKYSGRYITRYFRPLG